MNDLLSDIDGLIEQATNERSHFYTAGVLKRAKAVICAADQIRDAQRAYMNDRGNQELGQKVAASACVYDALRGQK